VERLGASEDNNSRLFNFLRNARKNFPERVSKLNQLNGEETKTLWRHEDELASVSVWFKAMEIRSP
jgi:hypothetical protein